MIDYKKWDYDGREFGIDELIPKEVDLLFDGHGKTFCSRQAIVNLISQERQKWEEELVEKIEDMVGEEVAKENQLEDFDRYHTKLSNGKYLESCYECDNDQKILKVIDLIKEGE